VAVPTVIVVGQVWKASVQTHFANQLGENVYYFRVVSTVGALLTVSGFLAQTDSIYAGFYKAAIPNTGEYRGTLFAIDFPLPRSDPIMIVSNSGAGTGGPDPLPTQVTGIWTKVTAGVGRSNRGRAYVPFPTTVFLAPLTGEPTVGYAGIVADIATAVTGVSTVITGANTTVIQWVLRTKVLLPVPAIIYKDIVDWRRLNLWGTQRRRGDFGRPNP
jgi:hypothetical protein